MFEFYFHFNFTANGLSAWIGAFKNQSQNAWVWTASNRHLENTFTDWNPSEPNRDGSCAHMWDQANYRWNDIHCRDHYSFLCENP